MKKCYDLSNKRLIFCGAIADNSQYWDSLWSVDDFPKYVKDGRNPFIVNSTAKYLPKRSKILEGGCGRGDKVYALWVAGYDAYGIDFAKETVNKINEAVPELNVKFGDLRHLDFPDCFFDGYWSIGVIEHFFDGYMTIAEEMYRVLRKGGYLFLTVPTMSVLRKIKASLRLYPDCEHDNEIRDKFYQFALSQESVIEQFTSIGFKFVKYSPRDGVKGLKDEIGILRSPLQWCWEAKSIFARVMKKIIDFTVKRFSGHMAFYVFKKI